MAGHGDVNFRGATLDNYDLNADYGGQAGNLGYYFFVDGFTSGRFLDPPEPKELYDFGKGARATAQFDYRAGDNDSFKLLLMGGGDNFQQPNITDDQEVGRDAQRHLRQQTAILTWHAHLFTETLLSTSLYERVGSDRVFPTTRPDTPLSSASRAPLTLGIKSDLSHVWHGHVFKAGVDLVRLREHESFSFDSRGDPDVFPTFSGGLHGGQASVYLQDHFSPVRNLASILALRYDYFDLVDTAAQISPRVGLAYHFTKTKSVLHAAYNRYFSPPPIEYSLLASFIGNNAIDPDQRVGNVRAYRQNYYEVGWAQELHPRVSLELNAYLHTGHNSASRITRSASAASSCPSTFTRRVPEGRRLVLNMKQLEHFGISWTLPVRAVAKTYFYGPITGGFAGDEPLDPGERIIPAFDQTHTGTAQIFLPQPLARILGRAARCATAAARSWKTARACRSISPAIWPPESICGMRNRAGSIWNSTSPTSRTAFTRSPRRAKRSPSSTRHRARWVQPQIPFLRRPMVCWRPLAECLPHPPSRLDTFPCNRRCNTRSFRPRRRLP